MSTTVWERLAQTGLVFFMIGFVSLLGTLSDDGECTTTGKRIIAATFALAAACFVIGALGAIWT